MNQPIHRRAAKPETTRMFESDFIERFSRIHPATPFVAYVPLIALGAREPLERNQGDLGLARVVGLVMTGLLIWTLTEYVLHRYVFHWTGEQTWKKRVHFLLHGVHHDFPNDRDRLVMPLGASLPMAVLFYVLFYFTMGGSASATCSTTARTSRCTTSNRRPPSASFFASTTWCITTRTTREASESPHRFGISSSARCRRSATPKASSAFPLSASCSERQPAATVRSARHSPRASSLEGASRLSSQRRTTRRIRQGRTHPTRHRGRSRTSACLCSLTPECTPDLARISTHPRNK